MFRKDNWFTAGWLYFAVMFVLEAVLPEWVGDENGIIENLQMLWLFGGFYYCYKMQARPQINWGGKRLLALGRGHGLLFSAHYARNQLGTRVLYGRWRRQNRLQRDGALRAAGASHGGRFDFRSVGFAVQGKNLAGTAARQTAAEIFCVAAAFYFDVVGG